MSDDNEKVDHVNPMYADDGNGSAPDAVSEIPDDPLDTPGGGEAEEGGEAPEPAADAQAVILAQLGLRRELWGGDVDTFINNWCQRAAVSTWLDVTIITAILINTVLLAVANPANQFDDHVLEAFMYIDMVLTSLFTWEMFVRIQAMGFYNPKYKLNPLPDGVSWPEFREGKERQKYLNDSWNKLDFVVVVSSWVNILVEATGVQLGIEVSTLRALRVLRVLRSLKFFSGIKTILSVIAQALPYSLNVIAFMGFLYIVCGIIGIQMFRGHTLSRCEYGAFYLQSELAQDKFPLVIDTTSTELNNPYPYPNASSTLVKNLHPNPKPILAGGVAALSLPVQKRTTPFGKGFEYPIGIGMWYTYCTTDEDCPLFNKADEFNRTQVCVPSLNPGKNQHSFDMILDGWVALFINMANLYWWETAHRIVDANDGLGSLIAWEYGLFNVMFLTYVSVNMFVAVITTVFADVRSVENPAGGFKPEIDKPVKEIKKWNKPFYYITALGGPGGPYVQKAMKGDREGSLGDKEEREGFINTTFFDNFIMAWILFNTIILWMDHHDIKECCKNVDTHERCIHFELGCECEFNPDDKCQSQAFIDNTKILNYIFNFVFCCELILKVLGMGFKAYISVTFNQLDFFIVVTSVLDMVGELTRKEGEQGSMGIFKLFRVFRLFRVLRVARFLYKNKNLKRILKTVFGSGAALGNLGLFISFSIMLFAIIGMHIFGGNYHPNNAQMVDTKGFSTFGSCANPNRDDHGDNDPWDEPGDTPGAYCTADNSGTLFGRLAGNANITVTHEGLSVGYGYDVGDLIKKGLIPRRNFEDFGRAFLLAFQVMTGDDWVNQMHDYMYVFTNSAAPAILFFVNFAFCNFILLSLFIAVILENFEVAEAEKMKMQLDAHKTTKEEADEARKKPKVTFVHRISWLFGGTGASKGFGFGFDKDENNIHPLTGNLLAMDDPTANLVSKVLELGVPEDLLQWSIEGQHENYPEEGQCPVLQNEAQLRKQLPGRMDWAPTNEEIIEIAIKWSENAVTKEELEAIEGQGATKWYSDDISCFCMPKGSAFREVCVAIANNYIFIDWIVLFAILLGTVLLAWEGPPGSLDPDLRPIFDIIGDYVLFLVFMVEFLAKVFAYGFLTTPDAFLKNHWNKLDFAVICGSMVTILGGEAGPVRLLRCLRPLRMVARNEGMRIIITAVTSSLAANMGVLALASMGGLIFAILGVSLFGGQFYSCNCFYAYPKGVTPNNYTFGFDGVATWAGDNGTFVKPESPAWANESTANESTVYYPVEVDSKKHCLGSNLEHLPGDFSTSGVFGVDPNFADAISQCYWDNRPYNFDTTAHAMQALFTASTLAGWTDIMEIGLDTRGIDMQPRPFATPVVVVYFLFYVLIMAFFTTNLFVGVLIDFIGHSDGTALLTEEQQKLNDMDKFKRLHRPMEVEQPPANCLLNWFYGLVESKFWDTLSNGVIIFNVVVMLCEFESMTDSWFQALEFLNYVCLLFFTFEMCFKLLGWGPIKYGKDPWSQFDFSVILMSWLAIWLELGSVQAIRAMRAFRIVLVLKSAKGIRSLFQTLILSISPAINITVLLLLLYAFYAVLGMQLWGNAPLQDLECLVNDTHSADFCKVGTWDGWSPKDRDSVAYQDFLKETADLYQSFGGISKGRPGHMLMGSNRQYTHHSSFRTFTSALSLLFQCAAGQDWKFVMYAVGGEPGMSPEGASSLKGPGMAFFYFASFFFFSNYILLNLFIAVILDNFAASMREQELDISEADFEHFKYLFRSKTPDTTPEIVEYRKIWELLWECGSSDGHDDYGEIIEHPFSPPPREEWQKEQETAWKLSLGSVGAAQSEPLAYSSVKAFIFAFYEEGNSPLCVDRQPGYDSTKPKYKEGDSQAYWDALIGTPAVFINDQGTLIAVESEMYQPWEDFRQYAIASDLGQDVAAGVGDTSITLDIVREALQSLRYRINFNNVLGEFAFHNNAFINETSTLSYDEILRGFVQNRMGHASLTLEEQLRRDPGREDEIGVYQSSDEEDEAAE